MFDEVTKREGGKRAARKAGFVVGSTAFQVALVALIVVATAKIKAAVTAEPVVAVKFVKPASPPPPPPPPPAPPPVRKRPPAEKKPPANLPPPPPPQALVQPKEVKEEIKIDPNEPKEPEYDYGASSGDGVVGGVVGAPAAQPAIEDAPAYATAGFVRPQEAQHGCVRNSVRLPQQLQGLATLVTVKFAIGRDGAPSMFQVMSDLPDPRIGQAIWTAIQACRWSPGTDPHGKPTKILVILPLRFAQG